MPGISDAKVASAANSGSTQLPLAAFGATRHDAATLFRIFTYDFLVSSALPLHASSGGCGFGGSAQEGICGALSSPRKVATSFQRMMNM
eukprot:CAMPEP_0196657866 /NCGR_PEP_ID=MMETSP1086-20130531/26184_1 /TAXON_ID=77921 /ORGANISM="Cyanoptyche  gloeocystis , Strain SAG4.97" /LENGTH=88 /DNA_ID=CAMNT_0041991177 /DNA_START=217 /DNA_END=483 /DNA_ORIENTATION=-